MYLSIYNFFFYYYKNFIKYLKMVKDSRTGFESTQTEKILSGDSELDL